MCLCYRLLPEVCKYKGQTKCKHLQPGFWHWSPALFSCIHNMATNNTDPEKGLVSASARSAIPSWASSAPDNTISNESSRLTPLQLFQLLVGIYTPPFLTRDGVDLARATNTKTTHRRTDNVGLYRRAQEQERASRLAYQSTSFISNLLYMLQILLAATFTALSAYKDSNPVTLTVLGACNTVVAG